MTAWEMYWAVMQGLGVGAAIILSIAIPGWLIYLLVQWLLRIDERRWIRASRQAAAQMGTPHVYTQPSARVRTKEYYECPSCGTNDPNLYIRCNDPRCPDGRDPR